MIKVVREIAKIEFRRLKTKLWLLFVLVIGFSATIGCQKRLNLQDLELGNMDVRIETHSNGITSTPSVPNFGGVDFNDFFTVAPFLGAAATCLGLGFLVLLTMPFRGGEERQLGCLQLLWLSNPSFPKIEAIRYGIYFAIGVTYYIVVGVITWIYGVSQDILSSVTLLQGAIVIGYWFFSLLALAIALGGLITGLNNAYANLTNKWPIQLLINLGILGIALQVKALASFTLDTTQPSMLPLLTVPIGDPLVYEIRCPLPLDFWLVTGVAVLLLVAWTGRIYDEMEI